MKKSVASKTILGIIAAVIVVVAVVFIIKAHDAKSASASLVNVTIPVGTITPQRACITSGRRMSAPWVQVTSPNGGEVYQAGQQVTVKWTSCNIPRSTPMLIALNTNHTYNGGFFNQTLTSSAPNSGQATVTFPSVSQFTSNNLSFGDYYKIVVNTSPWTQTAPQDLSDNLFTINDTSGIIVNPNGTPTANAVAPGGGALHSTITFSIPFSVTASGSTAYIPSAGQMTDPGGVLPEYIQYSIDNGNPHDLLSPTSQSYVTYTGNGSLVPDAAGNYKIPAGQTKTFLLTVAYFVPTAGQYRASLANVSWNLTDSGTVWNTYPSVSGNSVYQTPYVAAQ